MGRARTTGRRTQGKRKRNAPLVGRSKHRNRRNTKTRLALATIGAGVVTTNPMIGAGAATTDTATGGKNMNPCKKPSKCSVCRSVQLSVKTQTDRGPRKGSQVEDWDHYIPSPGPFMAISRPNDLVDPPDSELHRTPSRPSERREFATTSGWTSEGLIWPRGPNLLFWHTLTVSMPIALHNKQQIGSTS